MNKRLVSILKLVLMVFALSVVPAYCQVTAVPADVSTQDKDETAQGTGMVYNKGPLVLPMTAPLWGSDLVWASEHDARWGFAATAKTNSAYQRAMAQLAKGNTFFVKTGDTFGKILQAYQEISKMVELYKVMENMVKFMENYRLTVNLYRFLPMIDVMAPDEMGGGQAFAVGIMPKDSTGWEARANLLRDNPWHRQPGGLRLVEVRYPRSLNDLTLDSSVWGVDSEEEENFQKMLLSGFYEGVVSAGRWMNNAGIGTNLAENIKELGPRAFERRINEIVQRRLIALQTRRDFLQKIANGQEDMPTGMTPAKVLEQIALIDKETNDLIQKDQMSYISAQMRQQIWMRQAGFVNEILAKLENRERRLALMKLRERYGKYEKFWSDPDQMNPTPEITGDPKVDKVINLAWSSLTLLSKGKIPPPVPVPGGPAAIAQSTMVRSMYREFLVDELRAVRRLLAFRYSQDKQTEVAEKVVQDAKDEVDSMMDVLDRRTQRIKTHLEYAEARKVIYDAGEGWAFNMPWFH